MVRGRGVGRGEDWGTKDKKRGGRKGKGNRRGVGRGKRR